MRGAGSFLVDARRLDVSAASFWARGMTMNGNNDTVFIGGDIYRQAGYGNNHPLTIPRVGPVMDICRHMGWLDGDAYVESSLASREDLIRFHAPAYVDAVIEVDQAGKANARVREQFGLGTLENPVFRGLYERAATNCGGSIYAAERVLDGGCAYNPAGGTHHGRPAKASGFCYFNDPVLSVYRFLDAGMARVLYLDLDAHHGDGVEDAFADDPRVATVSIHEQDRWPYSGTASDPSRNIWNFPVPRGFSDAELEFLMEAGVMPVHAGFAPDAVVITCGADGLAGDPLSAMNLSNVALWSAVTCARDATPRTVVLGGGGYNPWTVTRCWAGLWAVLAGHNVDEPLLGAVASLFGGFESDLVDEEDVVPAWRTTIADIPVETTVRPEVERLALQRAA